MISDTSRVHRAVSKVHWIISDQIRISEDAARTTILSNVSEPLLWLGCPKLLVGVPKTIECVGQGMLYYDWLQSNVPQPAQGGRKAGRQIYPPPLPGFIARIAEFCYILCT